MIIKKSCKFCGKVSDLTSEINLGSSGVLKTFQCGHSYIEESLLSTPREAKDNESNEVPQSLLEKLEQEIPSYCSIHERNCIKTIETGSRKHLFPYQRDGVVAATKAGGNFIFADEMGLGKTIQAECTILINKEKMLPAIFVCKSIAKTNMLWETLDTLEVPAQVISSSSDTPFTQFKVHIISHDMISRLDKIFKFSEMKNEIECPECHFRCDDPGIEKFCPDCAGIKQGIRDQKRKIYEENEKIITVIDNRQVFEQKKDKILMVPYTDKSLGDYSSRKDRNKAAWKEIIQRCKTIIIDESHLIKNPEAQRSKAIKKLASFIPHRMGLSGTLIKNNATEYFTILNIVKPEKFYRYTSFCYNYVRQDYIKTVTGYANKWTGLKDPEAFKEMTKDFMIRRTTDEVLPELPKLFKQPKYVELEEGFQQVYDESVKDFTKWFDNADAMEIRTNLLAQLAILRHQTSLMKIDSTIDILQEYLMSSEGKIAIFTHHLDSRDILAEKIDSFFDGLNKELESEVYPHCHVLTKGQGVQEEIEEFKIGKSRVILLSTLSHGESINLQFMHNSILHERQWNPANEDQAISGRFRRIGQESTSINCFIPIALGTIDEYYVEVVERKRAVGKEIDTGEIETWNEGFVAELAEKIAQKGRERWKL